MTSSTTILRNYEQQLTLYAYRTGRDDKRFYNYQRHYFKDPTLQQTYQEAFYATT